jgi:antitoxin component YwqK of YwqJK toxin-antitoxin module
MRYKSILFVIMLAILGCRIRPINQKENKKREGHWVETYALDSARYKAVGAYHQGDPIKKWRYFLNGKIIKKEQYKTNSCRTINYFENGKIQSKGQTKTTADSIQTHWFYDGDWKFYNEKGKLIGLKKYKEGQLLSDIIIKK